MKQDNNLNNENEDSEFNQTLHEIWDKLQKPFIAQNYEGWYVLVYKNPHEQYKKWNERMYGKIDMNLESLLRKTHTQEIFMGGCAIWKLITSI